MNKEAKMDECLRTMMEDYLRTNLSLQQNHRYRLRTKKVGKILKEQNDSRHERDVLMKGQVHLKGQTEVY